MSTTNFRYDMMYDVPAPNSR